MHSVVCSREGRRRRVEGKARKGSGFLSQGVLGYERSYLKMHQCNLKFVFK